MSADTINWDAIDLFLKNGGHLEIESPDNTVDIYAVKNNETVTSAEEYPCLYDALEEIGYALKRIQA